MITQATHAARLRLAEVLTRAEDGLTIADIEGMPWSHVLPWSNPA